MHIMQLDALTYVGPQISVSDMPEIKRLGICKLIITRPDGETDDQPTFFDINRAANAVGIEAHQIPVVSGQITDADASAYDKLVADAAGPVLAYCRSGMRATSLWALNQAKTDHVVADIQSAAQAAGFDLTPLIPRLFAHSATTVS